MSFDFTILATEGPIDYRRAPEAAGGWTASKIEALNLAAKQTSSLLISRLSGLSNGPSVQRALGSNSELRRQKFNSTESNSIRQIDPD